MTKPPVCSSQCRPEAASTQPVCGSDGQTYTNLCQLESESCKNPAKGLYMLTDAPCKAGKEPKVARYSFLVLLD